MLLENNPYRQDTRVRSEASTLVAAGHRVSVICPRGPESRAMREQVAPGVTLYQYPAPPERGGLSGYLLEYGYSMVMMLALSLVALVRGGFDVVHAHNPPDVLVLVAAIYKPFGKRFVFDHHDLSPEMYGARFGPAARPAVRRALEWFEMLSFRLADQVISSNESYRRMALARGRVDPAHVTVVRNGPDMTRMRAVEADAGLRGGAGIVLGYVGIMGPQDGVDHLLRAVRHLVFDFGRTDVLCYVIGRGDMLSELEELARTLDIEKHVEFTGWVSPDELPTYLAAMDICIDPDPSNEYNDRCTMIKMMEYMALAKPIVAFDLPEHRVSAGEAALYAGGNDEREMARLIAELIDDPQRRATMGAIGRRRVESALAWQFQAANLIECYDRLADRGLRTPATTRPHAGYPSVSVTIVNHRARDLLRNCLRSLQRHPYTLGEMQVVVVDNASGDGSLEMVRSEFPEVLLRAESRRRGFGANQNRAVAAATGDVLFILNPDTEVHEHTIDRLVAALVAGGAVGSAGGPTINADGSYRQERPHAFPTPWSPYVRAFGLGRVAAHIRRRAGAVRRGWPSGGAFLIDRAAFDAVGGFDEGYFRYSEDTDLFARLLGHGFAVTWVADAVVTHPHPTESAGDSRRRVAEAVRSELRYMTEYHGRLGALVYRLGVGFDAAIRALAFSTPGLSHTVKHHGMDRRYHRRTQLARLSAVAPWTRQPGLAELAAGWNRQHAVDEAPMVSSR
jgi:GT2 family glycosyltransferase/glycosyltransferase involved in cell wall biosynthesis